MAQASGRADDTSRLCSNDLPRTALDGSICLLRQRMTLRPPPNQDLCPHQWLLGSMPDHKLPELGFNVWDGGVLGTAVSGDAGDCRELFVRPFFFLR